MGHSLLRKSQRLLEFIDQGPLRAQLVTYLSENFSLEDELCAVGVIQLARDGTLHCVAAGGFIEHDPMAAQVFDINSSRPTSKSVRNHKLKILDAQEMSSFLEHLPTADRQNWRTGVTIPVGMELTYFFFLKEDATLIDDYFDFISMVASLLTRFESNLLGERNQKSGNWFRGEGKELTERESQIEAFIVQGLTNAQIADQLGYSESLIRQETVSIYRKLGVSGRKEILSKKVASDETNDVVADVTKDEMKARTFRDEGMKAVVAVAGIETFAPIIDAISTGPDLF